MRAAVCLVVGFAHPNLKNGVSGDINSDCLS